MNSKTVGLILCLAFVVAGLQPLAGIAAPPTLQHLFPAGGQRGTAVDVTAAGTFDKWPVTVWVDRPGVTAVAATDKGKFTVTIAEDAAPGTYWLRATHAEGASSVRPFVVGMLDEVVEVEASGAVDQSQAITGPTTINGRLEKGGDVDTYQLELKADQTLVAALDANRTLGSPMDSVLQVCDERGFVIEQNDDARGTDPMVVLRIPHDGRYHVRVFAFPETPNSTIGFAGSKDFVYRLTLTTGGFVDHALPMSVPTVGSSEVQLFGWNLPGDMLPLVIAATSGARDATLSTPSVANSITLPAVEQACVVASDDSSPKQPQAIQLPAVISGRVEAQGDVDAFRFTATKGDKLFFRVESDALGFLLDPFLALVDSSGKVVAEVDDTARQRDCELAATIPADGAYDLHIRDLHHHGGFRYVYRLTAMKSEPDFELSLAQDAFLITPGKPLEVEVTVGRLRGFNDAIQITAIELPAGVTVKPATSEAKGDSSKKVKLEFTATGGPTDGTFRISGSVESEGGLRRNAYFKPKSSTDGLDQPWLTVLAP